MPYRSGPPPEGAIVHTYETRCLPGDEGRNPYVLASCGSNGYPLQAVVTWRISFTASGPIDNAGALPARTTAAEAPFPVSESRAFLVAGGFEVTGFLLGLGFGAGVALVWAGAVC